MPLIAKCDNCGKELPVRVQAPLKGGYELVDDQDFNIRMAHSQQNHYIACRVECGLAIDKKDSTVSVDKVRQDRLFTKASI